MSYSTYTDISQTIDWINSTFIDEQEWNWAFVLKAENKVIGPGSIGPNVQMKDYWGIGYCTEAMKAIIDFAYKKLGVEKICSSHAVDNPRPSKVMEKCGLGFDHYGEYTKLDGSKTFKAKNHRLYRRMKCDNR